MMALINAVVYAIGWLGLCGCVGCLAALLTMWWKDRPLCKHCEEPLGRFARAKLCPACNAGYHTSRDEFLAWLHSWEAEIRATREEIRRRSC